MYVFLPPPTTGLAAWFLSLVKRTPFLCDVQDIWPEAVVASGMMGEGRASKVISRVQKFIYDRARLITVPSPGYKKNLIAKGIAEDRIEVVPNWADTDVYRPVPFDDALAESFELKGTFNVLFAGNLGIVQALDTVIKAAELLRDVPEIRFVFAGSGVEENRLRALVEQKGLDNVRFLGRFPHEQMARIYGICDVLLVHLKHDPLFEITIPSKTLAYLACSKPVLMAVEGDAADLVESAGAGRSCASQDPRALADAVKALYDTPEKGRQAMGAAGRAYFMNHCTLDIVVAQFERLLGDLGHA